MQCVNMETNGSKACILAQPINRRKRQEGQVEEVKIENPKCVDLGNSLSSCLPPFLISASPSWKQPNHLLAPYCTFRPSYAFRFFVTYSFQRFMKNYLVETKD